MRALVVLGLGLVAAATLLVHAASAADSAGSSG